MSWQGAGLLGKFVEWAGLYKFIIIIIIIIKS